MGARSSINVVSGEQIRPLTLPYLNCLGPCLILFTRELQREKVWSRIHLIPLLLAEADRAAYHLRLSDMALEAAIMKDVPGWEVRLYGHMTKR